MSERRNDPSSAKFVPEGDGKVMRSLTGRKSLKISIKEGKNTLRFSLCVESRQSIVLADKESRPSKAVSRKKSMKIIGYTGKNKSGLAVAASVHGLGTGVETLLEKFHAEGGKGGETWAIKYPFHRGIEGDDFSKWCAAAGITLAKSKDGAWAVAVKTESIVKRDSAGYPLAVGAEKVGWLADV